MAWLFPTRSATEPTISVNTIIAIKSSDIVNPSCELESDDRPVSLVCLRSFDSPMTFISPLRFQSSSNGVLSRSRSARCSRPREPMRLLVCQNRVKVHLLGQLPGLVDFAFDTHRYR